jgi:hypothetical protein
MFKSILFTFAFIIPALTSQQSAQQSPAQTAQLHECGWFLCKPPVQTAQLHECGWFLCKPPVQTAQRHECGWFLCKPPVNEAVTAATVRELV